MVLNAEIHERINRSEVYPLIELIPGSVTGNDRTLLIKRIFRNQKAKIRATWPTS